jgi:hypothetical protein
MKNYEETFKFVAQSKVVPIVLITWSHPTRRLIQSLYDAGIKKGELVLFAPDWMYKWVYDESAEPDQRKKIETVLEGAIGFA